ncbi:hypothetical protein [endosymbiont of Lamellibrachia barhami]|nr:hypothetical protein [endosymbiont of Lamellibrachia barhami]
MKFRRGWDRLGSYARPFTPESHDALKQEQVFMARFREDGVIVPLSLGRK